MAVRVGGGVVQGLAGLLGESNEEVRYMWMEGKLREEGVL